MGVCMLVCVSTLYAACVCITVNIHLGMNTWDHECLCSKVRMYVRMHPCTVCTHVYMYSFMHVCLMHVLCVFTVFGCMHICINVCMYNKSIRSMYA